MPREEEESYCSRLRFEDVANTPVRSVDDMRQREDGAFNVDLQINKTVRGREGDRGSKTRLLGTLSP